MPFETLLTNPNPSVPRTKSILSRFSNPLSKRNAKIFDFDIEPEHPHKIYKPGDKVKGHVVLSVFKGFDITHLVVSLHGYARVFKHQSAPGEVKDIPDLVTNGKGRHDFEYHGNGLASLFQDELVLCGSGFLRKQVYKFEFELQFPSRSLPSTIEFERGDVNYVLTATVTRPTAIMPTMSRVYKVKFEDRIDIESMYTPKSRAIYMEPMIKRGKVKRVRQTSSAGTDETATARTLSRQTTTTTASHRNAIALTQQPPLSPAPSQSTFESNTSESLQSLPASETHQRQGSLDTSEPPSSTTSNSVHTISAVTEILRHGALPGESVTVRVKVEHTKAARGIIIATLFRQSRIDMHPPLPVASRSKKKKPEYEDVYPKSRTGLGGLYFTNGTPNMAFRMDLSQASTMMIVDPTTRTADVRFSIRIPENAFPTMDSIPGGMISFLYFIEVVVDLTGKLGESRLLPSLTTTGPSFTQAGDVGNQLTTEWANNILDTAPLRRTKNVASFELPIIIGTEDSSRQRRLQEANAATQATRQTDHHTNSTPHHNHDPNQTWYQHDNGYNYGYGYEYDEDGNEVWYDDMGRPLYNQWDYPQHQHYPPPQRDHPYVPPPPPQEEEYQDEKSRLRRQEELLLPSAPPESEASSSTARRPAPTAPVINGDLFHIPHSQHQPIPIIGSRASARSADTIVLDPLTPPPSLPETEIEGSMDDKQELERRRLLAQASAPPAEDEDEVAGPSNSRGYSHQRPSAPVVNEAEEEEYLSQILRTGTSEALPQYRQYHT